MAALLAYGVDEDATEVKGESRLKAARAALTRAAKYPGSQLAVYVAHLLNDFPTNELCSLSSFAVVTSFCGNRWVARQGALVVDPDHKNALSHCEALMSTILFILLLLATLRHTVQTVSSDRMLQTMQVKSMEAKLKVALENCSLVRHRRLYRRRSTGHSCHGSLRSPLSYG